MKSLNEFLNEAKDVGHYEKVGNQTIVDSNFVNYSKGVLPGSELVHLGMGDFQLKTPKGKLRFNIKLLAPIVTEPSNSLEEPIPIEWVCDAKRQIYNLG